MFKNQVIAVRIFCDHVGLTVDGCRSLVVLVPHGDAAVVTGRGAVLAADRVAAGGQFGGLCSRRRQRWRGESGGGRKWWRGGRWHLRHYWFAGDVVRPRSLLLRGQEVCFVVRQ